MYRAYRHMRVYWRHTGACGTYRGCTDVWGAYRCMGVYKFMGSIQMYRAYRNMGDVLGAFRCMGTYRACTGYEGIQMYRGHTDV